MAVQLHHGFLRVFSDYIAQRLRPLRGNSLAVFVRNELAESVRTALSRPDLLVQGSVGQGNWAEIPWIGIFNPENTASATRGVYVVYLFSADLETLYLCQGQGVTQVKTEFGRDQVSELQRRCSLIRSRIPEFKKHFVEGPIALKGSANLAKEYEQAVAYYKAYSSTNLADEDMLEADLHEMIRLYDLLVTRGTTDNIETAVDLGDDGDQDGTIEERRRYVRHSRIERKSAAAQKAKKIHGLVCQGCGFDFARFYGDRGQGYIEAHHLIPLHSLPEGKVVSMNPKTDFAVLCSNCHRMVHRKKDLLTLDQLKGINGVRALRRAFEKKKGAT